MVFINDVIGIHDSVLVQYRIKVRESDFFFHLSMLKCEHYILYEPIWKQIRFRVNINEA